MTNEYFAKIAKNRTGAIRKSARRGVALLIVSLVIAMLTLGGATLLILMKTERDATTTRGLETLVASVDRSAVVFLIGTVESTRKERAERGGIYDNPQLFCAAPLLTLEDGSDETSRFTVLSPKFDVDRIEGVRYGLVDESTRLNLAAVLDWETESPGAGRAALMKLPGMTAVAADSILDWIDPDENARANGGESKYYSDRKAPYSPRNAVPVFLEELLLARGVARSQLYGADENFTFGVENLDEKRDDSLGGSLLSTPDLALSDDANTARAVPWKELLTVFSAEKDVDPNGEVRVDLNVDDLQFLYQELVPRVGEDLAKFAVLYRQFGAANAAEEGAFGRGVESASRRGGRRSGYFASSVGSNAPSVSSDSEKPVLDISVANLDFSAPATTKFQSPLDLIGARVETPDAAFESPITAQRNRADVNQLFLLLDFASTSESTTIVGRVNVNGAPRPVLEAIPGLTTADVQKILDARPSPTAAVPDDRRHAAWLYTTGVVDLPTMKRVYSKTTAFGDVFRGQIVGFLDETDVVGRAEVVVDGTTEPPRQVFYKDLTMNGKGFSDAILLGGASIGGSLQNGVPSVDWSFVESETGVFELDNPSRSTSRSTGYSFSSQQNPTADPFAAVQAETSSQESFGGVVGGADGAPNETTEFGVGIASENGGPIGGPVVDVGTLTPNARNGRSEVSETLTPNARNGRSEVSETLTPNARNGRSEVSETLAPNARNGRSEASETLAPNARSGRSGVSETLAPNVRNGRSGVSETLTPNGTNGRQIAGVRSETGRAAGAAPESGTLAPSRSNEASEGAGTLTGENGAPTLSAEEKADAGSATRKDRLLNALQNAREMRKQTNASKAEAVPPPGGRSGAAE